MAMKEADWGDLAAIYREGLGHLGRRRIFLLASVVVVAMVLRFAFYFGV